MNIAVDFDGYRWLAVDRDTYTGPPDFIGIGKTEADAIDDLLEQMEDAGEIEPREFGVPLCVSQTTI